MLSSSRDFKPTFSEEEFENIYVDMQRVYFVTLAKDTESPSPAQRRGRQSGKKDKDKSERDKEGEKKDEGKKDEKSKKASHGQSRYRRDSEPDRRPWKSLRPTIGTFGWWMAASFISAALSATTADDDEEDGGGRAEMASLLLQPGRSKRDCSGRRQQLPDQFRWQEDAGENRR